MYADYHLHSFYSDDSQTPMDDMVRRAIALGLEEICFTEHVDYGIKTVQNCDYDAYFAALEDMRQKYRGQIAIRGGIEFGVQLETIPQFTAAFESYPFDFENIGLCYFPRLSEEAPMKPSQVALEMIGIPASSKHPDAAWEFIKFYIQNGSMKSVADGKVPAYQKLDKTELAKLLVEGTPLTVEQGAMFFEDDLHTYTAVPGGLAAGDYKTIIQEQTGMYFLGEQELEETMTNIKEQVDAAIRAEMEAE